MCALVVDLVHIVGTVRPLVVGKYQCIGKAVLLSPRFRSVERKSDSWDQLKTAEKRSGNTGTNQRAGS